MDFYDDVWSVTDTQCVFLIYAYVNLTFQVPIYSLILTPNFIAKSCEIRQSCTNEDFSMYSAVVYANANSTLHTYTSNVRFLSVRVTQQNKGLISYMMIYALVSSTFVDNFTYHAPDIIDFWSLFYIWSGTIYLTNTNLS